MQRTSQDSESSLKASLLSSFSLKQERYLDQEEVFFQEADWISQVCGQRSEDGQCKAHRGDQKFSVAFSGGGIRAAAFQGGVLWRLAEENKLKDIEYFTAVSGGGYILSAFASHCMDPDDQPKEGEVKQWYLKVVAQTLTRMQENAGDFIRDFVKDPGHGSSSSSFLPRIFDIPILVLVTLFAITVNPFFYIFTVAVPVTHMVAFFYGPALRGAFCGPMRGAMDWVFLSFRLSNAEGAWWLFCLCVLSLFVFHIIIKVLPSCRKPQWPDRTQPRPQVSWKNDFMYALGHAAYGGLLRVTVILFVFASFISILPLAERTRYKYDERMQLCQAYISEQMTFYKPSTLVGGVPHQWACSDLHDGRAWFQDDAYKHFLNTPTHHGIMNTSVFSLSSADRVEHNDIYTFKIHLTYLHGVGVLYGLAMCVLTVIVLSLLLLPCWGSELFTGVVSVAGPLAVFGGMLKLGLVLVYAPITKNAHGIVEYDRVTFQKLVSGCFLLALCLLPFYEDLRAVLHYYYMRCITQNYFKNGKDVLFSRHYYEENKLYYCPFVILTGTSSDFQPPGEDDLISEVSLSPLYTGGEETQYVHTPQFRTLGKCAALTGAGCLDAISLTMAQTVSIRFWLEFLNLSWGDFITFVDKDSSRIVVLEDFLKDRFGEVGFKMAMKVARLAMRLPAIIVLFIVYYLWNVARYYEYNGYGLDGCNTAHRLYTIGCVTMAVAVLASFFYFIPGCGSLAVSAFLRQVHQVTRYFYVGFKPPRMLYVTDGGVQDCTGLSQLIIRRCERILLVLAAMDASDDLGVLKTALALAEKNRWCSFYDPKDPRRALSNLFKDYKDNKDMEYMRIGIYYPPRRGKPAQTGHLFIVKNRLPTALAGSPIEAPLSEGEITGKTGPAHWNSEAWEKLTVDMLGPCGCCDCCHTNGCNCCGPKFPQGNAHGYLFLTPKWCSSLVRLGRRISEGALQELTGKDMLLPPWERTLLGISEAPQQQQIDEGSRGIASKLFGRRPP